MHSPFYLSLYKRVVPMKGGMHMNQTLLMSIQKLYLFFQVSFLFWVYLLKGLFVVSLVPAIASLLLTTRDILNSKNEDRIREQFRIYYEQYRSNEILSFLFAVCFSLFTSSLWYMLTRFSGDGWGLLACFLVGYILVILTSLFMYSTYFIATYDDPISTILALSFVVSIRHIVRTMGLLLLAACLVYALYVNIVFFLAFAPFLYAIGVNVIVSRVTIGVKV